MYLALRAILMHKNIHCTDNHVCSVQALHITTGVCFRMLLETEFNGLVANALGMF